MKKTAICFCFLLLLSPAAQAADYLKQAYDLGLITTRMVLAYDACVKQGLIENDDKPSAEQRFQDAITKSRDDSAKDLPAGVTSAQVADAMQKALDTGRAAVKKQPLVVDEKKCNSVKANWPKFAKSSGLE